MFLKIFIAGWYAGVALCAPPPTWPAEAWSEPWPEETTSRSIAKTSSSFSTTFSSSVAKVSSSTATTPSPITAITSQGVASTTTQESIALPSSTTILVTTQSSTLKTSTTKSSSIKSSSTSKATSTKGYLGSISRSKAASSKTSAASGSAPQSTHSSTETYDPKKWIRHIADPKAGPTFQIILSAIPKLSSSTKKMVPDVDIYDVDLFRTDKKTIGIMKSFNKTVICYFSGGTYEPSRPDSRQFSSSDLGNRLAQWPSEKWVKLESTSIRRIMTNRMQLAHEKGCDAIDPDNIDAYGAEKTATNSNLLGTNGNGLKLTKKDSINYLRFLSQTAAKFDLAVGLKNGLEIIPEVRPFVQFAVNEECVAVRECNRYLDFLDVDKKPVFHIEYPAESTLLGGLGLGEYTLGASARGGATIRETDRKKFCADRSTLKVKDSSYFQTVLKMRKLDGWVTYCTGQTATTPTTEDTEGGGGRFSSRGNFVDLSREGSRKMVVDDVVQMDEWTRHVAEEDGYPFAPGMGSEQFISDEELMGSWDDGISGTF